MKHVTRLPESYYRHIAKAIIAGEMTEEEFMSTLYNYKNAKQSLVYLRKVLDEERNKLQGGV